MTVESRHRSEPSARLLFEPVYQLSKSVVEPVLGSPAQHPLRLGDIERTPQQLTRTRIGEFDLRLTANYLPDRCRQVEHVALNGRRDIEGRIIEILTADCASRGEEVRTCHILDEDIVASLTPVAKDGERFLLEQTRHEDRHHPRLRLWVLPGAEYVGVPHGDTFEPAHRGERAHVILSSELAHTVGRDGQLGCSLWSRNDLGIAINYPTAAGENHSLDTTLAGAFQQVHEADHIDVAVERRAVHRHPHIYLC